MCVCVCVCVSVLVPRLLGEKLRKIKLTGIDLCGCEGLVGPSMCTWKVSIVCNIHSLIYTSHISTELSKLRHTLPTAATWWLAGPKILWAEALGTW